VKLELTKNKTPYDAQLMLAGAGGVLGPCRWIVMMERS
jgi:hypothetical protein